MKFLFRLSAAATLLTCLAMPGGAPLHAQTPGAVDPTFDGTGSGTASLGLAGNVLTTVLQPDGKILVAGYFRRSIVRLNADGSIDTAFQAEIDGDSETSSNNVSGVAVQSDGKIVIVGNFYEVDGIPEYSLARLNADGSLDTTFQPDFVGIFVVVSGGATPIAVQPDGKIIVFGQLNDATDFNFYGLARFNTDGSQDTAFHADTDNYVYALAVQPDGKIVVGGCFDDFDYTGAYSLTRLNPDGSVDTDFGAHVNNTVEALAVQPDGKIVIAGNFTRINGVSETGIARINTDGNPDSGFKATALGANDGVLATLALQPDGKIIVGGDFTGIDGVAKPSFARLNADGSLDASFIAATDGYAKTLLLQPDGNILLSGTFTEVDGTDTNSFVRLAPDGQLDASFNADVAPGPNAPVLALAQQPDGKVLIGGKFSQVSGASHGHLARLEADGTPDAAFQTSLDGDVDAMALQPDGKVLVGGSFTLVNGASHPGLARLNADGSLDATFAGTVAGTTDALAVQADGKILVGTFLDYQSPVHFTRLNPDGSPDAGFLANTGDQVSALVVQPDGKIVIAGSFIQVNGGSEYGLARLNADGSADPAFAGVTVSNPTALAVQPDGKIIFFGAFNNSFPYSLVRLNADGSVDTGFTPLFASGSTGSSALAAVNALAVQPDGKIIVAGDFTRIDGVSQTNIARLNADGSPDVFFNPGGSGSNGVTRTLTLQADGKIVVGGDFTDIDGSVRNYVARLNGGSGGVPDLFSGGVAVGGGFYYEQFPDGTPFGYYNLSGDGYSFPYFFHLDLGLEYFFDAQDGKSGAYLYDFASSTFFYTSPTFPWPYLYDFSLNTVLYYYPDPTNPGRYNTGGVRYFYDFATGKIIAK